MQNNLYSMNSHISNPFLLTPLARAVWHSLRLFAPFRIATLAVGLAFCASIVPIQNAMAQESSIFIPYVSYIAVPDDPCLVSAQANSMVTLINEHTDQQRSSLTCNPVLATVAQDRANDLATRNYFDHINPDGLGPNYLVAEAGYSLPSYYPRSRTANTIESIVAAGNGETAAQVLTYLLGSPGHRTHILGESSFYRKQVEIGVGYAFNANSEYGHYWVVLMAEPSD